MKVTSTPLQRRYLGDGLKLPVAMVDEVQDGVDGAGRVEVVRQGLQHLHLGLSQPAFRETRETGHWTLDFYIVAKLLPFSLLD